MRSLTTRLARATDAEAVARIYNEGIEDRGATFETEPRTTADMAALLAERGERYPTVIAEQSGDVVAFAWVGAYRSRPCYRGVGEFTVYVARRVRGTGAGSAVLAALIAACEARGFWKLVSRIFPENAASRRLCRKLEFREVGIYERHGKLDGTWRDCVIVEKLIGEACR